MREIKKIFALEIKLSIFRLKNHRTTLSGLSLGYHIDSFHTIPGVL